MLELIPEPDGRVAIYDDGQLLGRARNQEHAEDWRRRYLALAELIAPTVWEMGEWIWARLPPEERRRLSRPKDAREPVERAA